MPRILTNPDNLDAINGQFIHEPLREPVFLNSVPKCGTHLIRNIIRMFVSVDQHVRRDQVGVDHAVVPRVEPTRVRFLHQGAEAQLGSFVVYR